MQPCFCNLYTILSLSLSLSTYLSQASCADASVTASPIGGLIPRVSPDHLLLLLPRVCAEARLDAASMSALVTASHLADRSSSQAFPL